MIYFPQTRTHGDTDIFTNVITPFTNPVKHGEKPQSNNVIIDNEPFFPGINCGTHSDTCINVPTPVTNMVKTFKVIMLVLIMTYCVQM